MPSDSQIAPSLADAKGWLTLSLAGTKSWLAALFEARGFITSDRSAPTPASVRSTPTLSIMKSITVCTLDVMHTGARTQDSPSQPCDGMGESKKVCPSDCAFSVLTSTWNALTPAVARLEPKSLFNCLSFAGWEAILGWASSFMPDESKGAPDGPGMSLIN